ncbi:MAG: hypothetical protein ACYSW2_20480, partial [Planctomycetota bacterium]
GQVLYLAEKRACRRFPRPASADLFGGMARDFQVSTPSTPSPSSPSTSPNRTTTWLVISGGSNRDQDAHAPYAMTLGKPQLRRAFPRKRNSTC